MAELADAQDLKSWVPKGACGFDSRPRHSYVVAQKRLYFSSGSVRNGIADHVSGIDEIVGLPGAYRRAHLEVDYAEVHDQAASSHRHRVCRRTCGTLDVWRDPGNTAADFKLTH
jgi:hypothetical protein